MSFVVGLVSRSLFYRCLNRNVDVWDFQIEVFAWNVLRNRLFIEIAFYEFRDRFVSFFGGLGDRFSGFLVLENRLENRGILGDVTDPEFWIWWGGSTSDLDPQTDNSMALKLKA